jgi:hypothetical protein
MLTLKAETFHLFFQGVLWGRGIKVFLTFTEASRL